MMSCKPTSSLITLKSKEEAVALFKRFNPSKQLACGNNPTKCIMADVPTLANVRAEYGEQVARDWLIIQLNDYQNFLGIKEENKACLNTIKELAAMIVNRYFYLKLSELLLFMQQLKYGDYTEMYGVFDATKILKAIKRFLEERGVIIDREVAKRQREELESYQANAVSYEEYLRMKR